MKTPQPSIVAAILHVSPTTAVRRCRLLAASVTLVAGLLPMAAMAGIDPQGAALKALREASAAPVRASFAGGTARSLTIDIPAVGRTPIDQARGFLAQYGDLLLRHDDPTSIPNGGYPAVELVARGVYASGPMRMVVFDQRIGGLPVFGASAAIGLGESTAGRNRVLQINGSLVPSTQRPDLTPAIDEKTARTAAAAFLRRTNPPLLGEPQLMLWSSRGTDESRGPLMLVWALALGGGDDHRVFVDANDPEAAVVYDYPLSSDDSDLESWELDLEDVNGTNSVDTNCFEDTYEDDQMADEDGMFWDYDDDVQGKAMFSHLRRTYRYYHNHLGRHSFDDNGAEMMVYLYSGFSAANARSNGCGLEFADNFISLDVTGHEFTHAVVAYTSKLAYKDKSGALNESFADVFGEMIDPDGDWLHSEDLSNGQGANRSIRNPSGTECGPPADPRNCNQPDKYSDFRDIESDSGGVHTNSGIANKASYLMVEGGNHNGVPVAFGLGRHKFENLAYHVMRFLPSDASFYEAADLYLSTAESWAKTANFGFNASDACTVRNAWAAVELTDADSDCDGTIDLRDDSDGDDIWGVESYSGKFWDNCPEAYNPGQEDWDGDGQGDACDSDDDEDGCADAIDLCPGADNGPCYQPELDFDDDGQGNSCDTDDDNDGVADTTDNCPLDANPGQVDTDGNGEGDACDLDYDADGKFTGDNCPFVDNADQLDSDGDGNGDACDRCPYTADNANAYTPGIPELGIAPKPLQPDSDGDGYPDACDGGAFQNVSVSFDGLPFNPTNPLRPTGRRRIVEVAGIGDLALPLPVCGGDAAVPRFDRRVEITVAGVSEDSGLSLWITDEVGRIVARLSASDEKGNRGMRFLPDCSHIYTLRGRTGGRFSAPLTFGMRSRIAPAGKSNPWTLPRKRVDENTGPPSLPDRDHDGLLDELDNCPNDFNPTQVDSDGNGQGNACSEDCAGGGCPTRVSIDVLPGNEDNTIRLRSKGRLSVAVLSDEVVDATTIEPRSILVNGAALQEGRKGLPVKLADVDRDGRQDLLLSVEIPQMALADGDRLVNLIGRTSDGRSIHGADKIATAP